MELVDFSLQINRKTALLSKVNVKFYPNTINHILGSNGVGKSCLAKSLIGLYQYQGRVMSDHVPTVIGSYSNIPSDLTVDNLLKIIVNKYSEEKIKNLTKSLNLNSINTKLLVRKLSDGQKQKIKLMCFLITNPNVLILDEFSTAIDKKSALDIYSFLIAYVSSEKVTCLNITHNLSDLEYMSGKYFLFQNQTIQEIESKQEIIDLYVKG